MPTVLGALKRAWSRRPIIITAARRDRLAGYDWNAYCDGVEAVLTTFRVQYGAHSAQVTPPATRADLRLVHSA